jgi:hypothetical protein
VHLSRLRIENWKNFRDGDVDVGFRLFLIGPNASGKSNFLDVFRFLRDLSISGGGLQQAADVLRGGVSAIRCLAARRYSDVIIEATIDDDINKSIWRYRLSFNQDNLRRPIIKEERVERDGKTIVKRPNADDIKDPLRLTETALEQTSANQDFRPVVQFFQSVSYQHLLPQVVRDPQGFSPARIENDPYGRDFLQRVDGTPPRTRESRLKKILAALRVAAPKLTEIKTQRDAFGVPHLVGVFEHWRPGAGKQNEAQFSDGTLRLFGLLWTLFEGNGPLLMEEPELSLHTEVVRFLPQLIERVNRERKVRRQVIVSTHSPELLSDESIGGSEVLRLEPGAEGTLFKSPMNDPTELELLRAGLSVAEVVLPKSGPRDALQMSLAFGK